MPASSIEEANKEVNALSSRQSTGGKRRAQYVIVTPEQKAKSCQVRCRKRYNKCHMSFCQRYTRLERKYSEGLENCLLV